MTITQYQETHLPGILAICEPENWPNLSVHRAYRRKGIGRALLEYEHKTFNGFRIYPS